jgi:hypothetical protein
VWLESGVARKSAGPAPRDQKDAAVFVLVGPGMRETIRTDGYEGKRQYDSDRFSLNSPAGAQDTRSFTMAEQTESPDVVQIALTTAFAYRQNMVGIPEAPPAGHGLHAVEAKSCCPRRPAGALESGVHGHGINLAGCATSAITSEDLVAQISRIRAKSPLVNAVVAAEGAAAFREDLKLAPATERQAVRAFGKSMSRGAPTGQSTGNKHWFLRTESDSIRVGQTRVTDINRIGTRHQPGNLTGKFSTA